MKPEQYCLDMAAPAGSSLYYATLYSPAREKRKLHAIFAFQQELLNTVFECEDAGVARLKLQWWGEEIMRLFASESRHPVTRELEKLLPELQLQQNELLSLISAIEYEINPAAAESIQALIEQFISGRGISWRVAARACAVKDEEMISQLLRTGALINCLEHFLSAARHLQRGYCPYPLRELDKYGLSHEDLLHTGKLSAVNDLHAELYNTLFAELGHSLVSLGDMDKKTVLFAIIQAAIARANCKLMLKQEQGIMLAPPAITPLRKLWIAWRAKRA